MTPPKYRENSITQYSVREENIVGDVQELETNYDLITAVMICLGKYDDVPEDKNQLLKLLDVLLASDKNAEEKKQILERDFDIPMTVEMEGDVVQMCNLSDGVERRGIEKGIEKGIEQGIIALVKTLRELNHTDEIIIEKLTEKFDVTKEEAQAYLRM